MFFRSIQIIIILFVGTLGCAVAVAQSADNKNPLYPRSGDKDDQPSNVREMLEKMRIDKEKKDYDAMLDRGQQALDLTNQLEKSIDLDQKFTDKDREKLVSLEKLVKKIRSELGGGEDEDGVADQVKDAKPSTFAEGFKMLRDTTVNLVVELKKTTRFSISAAAIQTSNSVLRMTRFLRFWK